VQSDTVFWIASLTKAITTATALSLVEEGVISLHDPVAALLPELASPRCLTGFDADGKAILVPATGAITLHHLLTHTSGLAYEFCSANLARYREGQAPYGPAEAPDYPLVFQPGEGWMYGIGLDWAGKLMERATGKAFADLVAERVTTPLGMSQTSFFPSEETRASMAGVHQRLPDGSLMPIPFGMSPEPHFMMGGGGLHSTAPDYLTFLRAILGGGQLNGVRILEPQSVALMSNSQTGDLEVGVMTSAQPHLTGDFDFFPGQPKGWGYGFLLNQEPGPKGRGAGSLAWAGLANCYYWADPTTGISAVMLAQVLPFADPRVLDVFGQVETALYS